MGGQPQGAFEVTGGDRRTGKLRPQPQKDTTMKTLLPIMLASLLSGCGTLLAVADGVGTLAVYGVKTVVNTVDAITPDIVNKDD
jgi:hypothetical protein